MDATSLPIADGSLRSLVMTNVLHHLPDVRGFFLEAQRCLRPGGAIVMVEPWVTPWSKLIYGNLHHEPFDPASFAWGVSPGRPLSDANGALPWIVFERDRVRFTKDFPLLDVELIRPIMPFLYLLSGGVSTRALVPSRTFGIWRGLDKWMALRFPGTAMFALITVRRRAAA